MDFMYERRPGDLSVYAGTGFPVLVDASEFCRGKLRNFATFLLGDKPPSDCPNGFCSSSPELWLLLPANGRVFVD